MSNIDASIDERNLLLLLHGAVGPKLNEGLFGKPDKPEEKAVSAARSAVKDLPVDKEKSKENLWVEEIRQTHSSSISDIEVRTDGSVLVSMRAFADPVELNVSMSSIRAAMYGAGANYRDTIPLYTAELRFASRDNFERADGEPQSIGVSSDNQTKR